LALAKINELATLNLDRLTFVEPDQSGWNMLIEELHYAAGGSDASISARLMAADILGRVARDALLSALTAEDEIREPIQRRSFTALKIRHMQRSTSNEHLSPADESSLRVQEVILGTVASIIEQCGDSLASNWNAVFDILSSVFLKHDVSLAAFTTDQPSKDHQHAVPQLLSVRLGRATFASVQLICSDFLSSLPNDSMLPLVNLLFRFCSQKEDLNISLTVSLSKS